MTIGATIKQLRQEQDITQEQLADALGITSRAVSQWENGRTAPDISQLPALANFFDVTTDRLLGVDIKRKEEEIKAIIKHIDKFDSEGRIDKIIEYLNEKIKLYPREPKLIMRLAYALYGYYFGQGKADTDELEKEKTEQIVSLCQRALGFYGPNDDNSEPKHLMVLIYSEMGELDKARTIAESLPNIACTRDTLLDRCIKDEKEARIHRQETLFWSFLQNISNTFWWLYRDTAYNFEQKIEILDAFETVIRTVTGDEPGFYYDRLSILARQKAWCLLHMGEIDKSIDMLEAAYEYADRFETLPDGMRYTPCWLSEIDFKREYVLKHDTNTEYDDLYEYMTSPNDEPYETLKGNERFEKLVEKLKEKISK